MDQMVQKNVAARDQMVKKMLPPGTKRYNKKMMPPGTKWYNEKILPPGTKWLDTCDPSGVRSANINDPKGVTRL
jgi:hypothetical protein